MPVAKVNDFLSSGLDYIVVSKHKTALTYGDLAKYLAPGNQHHQQPKTQCKGKGCIMHNV